MEKKRVRKPLTEEQLRRKIAYNDQYNKSTMDVFHIKAQKSRHLPDRIEQAVALGIAPSKQAYIVNAIESALERDNLSRPTESGENT